MVESFMGKIKRLLFSTGRKQSGQLILQRDDARISTPHERLTETFELKVSLRITKIDFSL